MVFSWYVICFYINAILTFLCIRRNLCVFSCLLKTSHNLFRHSQSHMVVKGNHCVQILVLSFLSCLPCLSGYTEIRRIDLYSNSAVFIWVETNPFQRLL